jgi:hypothetical protein
MTIRGVHRRKKVLSTKRLWSKRNQMEATVAKRAGKHCAVRPYHLNQVETAMAKTRAGKHCTVRPHEAGPLRVSATKWKRPWPKRGLGPHEAEYCPSFPHSIESLNPVDQMSQARRNKERRSDGTGLTRGFAAGR